MEGYLAGGQCFGSVQEASDYKMSQVVPAVTADGSLKTPVYQNGKWYYGSQEVKLTFPPCDPAAYVTDGALVASVAISVAAFAFVIRWTIRVFQKTNEDPEK